MEKTYPIRIETNGGLLGTGEIRILSLSKQDRTRRTLKVIGMGLGLAIAAVFIPLVHFVLVPGILLVTPFIASFVYQQEALILGGTGSCPKCAAPFTMAKGQVRWPLQDVCSKCYEHVKIHRA